jgi:hypothetical protein
VRVTTLIGRLFHLRYTPRGTSYLPHSHLHDVTVLSAIFFAGELVGFGAKARWMDVGAREPGETTDSTEIHQESFRLGPTHLYRAGEPVRGVPRLPGQQHLPNAIGRRVHLPLGPMPEPCCRGL